MAQVFDLEAGQSGVDRYRAATQIPDGKEVDEELQRVAMVEKGTVAGGKSVALKTGNALDELPLNSRRVPMPTRKGLGKRSDV